MSRKETISLYQLIKTEDGNRYSHLVKGARGWKQKKPKAGAPGSYYLRLRKNGRPTFESVGDDLSAALQEMKDRQKVLTNPSPIVVLAPKLTLRKAIANFLQTRKSKKNWQYRLAVFGDWYGWEKDPTESKRKDWKDYAHHAANLGLRLRTGVSTIYQISTHSSATQAES